MPHSPPVVLSIAGFDPSSGAGITADIKTFAAHGCYGVACITALTVQSTAGVRRVAPVAPDLILATLAELADDLDIAAVKIGMLGSAAAVSVVAEFLSSHRLPDVVLDPILRSTSGAELLDPAGAELLERKLFPLVSVITPNLEEAAALTGLPVTNVNEMKIAATRLHELGAANIVITGGHLERPTDLLSFHGRNTIEQQLFRSERQRSGSTHGTGCAFASAIACHLAQGRKLHDAALLAKAYVAAAIAHASPLGRGIGPVDHLYRKAEQARRSAPHVTPEPVA
jgi:hydroxymethylpyrimidine/phosphomethylpyrimidine kinase